MNPWLESFGVLMLAVAGVLIGWGSSRLRKPYWLIGYCAPLLLILIYGLANHDPALALDPPVSWMMLGRGKFAVIGFVATMILTTPLSRLRFRRERIVVGVLMAVIVGNMSVWPFLAPAFNHKFLAHLQTHIDSDGICRQSTDYTCGPAAAVTGLRRLGLPAGEGEIAILAHTSSAIGTPPDMLADALQEHYGKDGLHAEYRVFRNLDALKRAGLTLAVMKFSFMLDHYVAVLDVRDDSVVVGDPLNGRTVLSLEEFKSRWRHVGVVLYRDQ